MGRIEKLTREEELAVLNSCYNKFDSNGSSRAVYLTEWRGKNVAVKVFIDYAGYYQSIENELQMQLSADNELLDVLTELYAYGHNCLICEVATPLCMDEVDEVCDAVVYEDLPEYIQLSIDREMYEKIKYVVDTLESYTGFTNDNRQIGISDEDGRLVCYDYGYTTEVNYDIQVGNMDDYLWDTNHPLDAAKWMVEQNEPFSTHFDEEFDEECEDEEES